LRAFLLGFSLWLSGCALVSPLKLNPTQLQALPPEKELSSVPFIQQQDYQCGPASLAMILNYYGQHTTPSDLVPWVFTPNAQGSFPAEMDAVTRQQGFISYPINGFEALLEEVNAGHPVLVLQNLGVSWYTKWHFAVVIGFDQTTQEVILRSGNLAQKRTPFHLFYTTWKRSERWARVVLPPHQLPATADALTYLKAAADLQQTGPATAALNAFKTAQQNWPENTTALFGLANQYYQMQQWPLAQHTYEQLLKANPSYAEGWNNYAYSLMAQRCEAQAKQAIRCAQTLAPEQNAFTDSANDIEQHFNLPQGNDRATCPMPVACPVATPNPTLH